MKAYSLLWECCKEHKSLYTKSEWLDAFPIQALQYYSTLLWTALFRFGESSLSPFILLITQPPPYHLKLTIHSKNHCQFKPVTFEKGQSKLINTKNKSIGLLNFHPTLSSLRFAALLLCRICYCEHTQFFCHSSYQKFLFLSPFFLSPFLSSFLTGWLTEDTVRSLPSRGSMRMVNIETVRQAITKKVNLATCGFSVNTGWGLEADMPQGCWVLILVTADDTVSRFQGEAVLTRRVSRARFHMQCSFLPRKRVTPAAASNAVYSACRSSAPCTHQWRACLSLAPTDGV